MGIRYPKVDKTKLREMAKIRGKSLNQTAKDACLVWGDFSKYLYGNRGIRPDRLERLAESLGCKEEDLIVEADWKERQEALEFLKITSLHFQYNDGKLSDYVSAWKAAAPYIFVKSSDALLLDSNKENHALLREALKDVFADGSDDGEDEDDDE